MNTYRLDKLKKELAHNIFCMIDTKYKQLVYKINQMDAAQINDYEDNIPELIKELFTPTELPKIDIPIEDIKAQLNEKLRELDYSVMRKCYETIRQLNSFKHSSMNQYVYNLYRTSTNEHGSI